MEVERMVCRVVSLSAVFIIICSLCLLSIAPSEGSAQDLYGRAGQEARGATRLEIPAGWTVYRGQTGLIVPHPQGWEVRERGGGAFVAFRPGSGRGAESVVCVRPIEKIEGKSAGVVQGVGRIESDLFPGAKAGKSRLVSNRPEVAVAAFSYEPRAGLPFRGVALCFKQEGRGVLYAIASRRDTWSREEPLMKKMLSAFFYSGGGQQGDGGREGGSALPAMVEWRDPLEGAFSCPVPRGWTVEGGLRRFSALDTRMEVVATSPDGRIVVRVGDASIPPFELPTQFGISQGLREGGWFSPDGVNRLLIMRYVPSTAFLTELYFPPRVGPIRNVQGKDFPEVSMQVAAQWQSAGMRARVDTGEISFEAAASGGARKGYAICQTLLHPKPTTPDAGVWFVTAFNSYLAAPSSEPVARAVLARMVLGLRWNPAWQTQQAQTNARVTEINRQTHEEISGIINRTWEERTRSQDRSRENWSQAFRGEVRIKDPATGERFSVPSGSNYYWRVGAGPDIVGTQTSDRPTMPNHWVKEMRVSE
jgi:hypothetical protein